MYLVFIVDNIHYLFNESTIQIFAYICDRRVYFLYIVIDPIYYLVVLSFFLFLRELITCFIKLTCNYTPSVSIWKHSFDFIFIPKSKPLFKLLDAFIIVLVSLTQLTQTMHNICKVWGSNFNHHKKKCIYYFFLNRSIINTTNLS